MPKAGDSYEIELKDAHLEWGKHRHTSTRGVVYGEGYLPIPRRKSKEYDIYNSNKAGANIVYNCSSVDGILKEVKLKASGSQSSGDVYAKQFQGDGDLQVIGGWYQKANAKVGDKVKISWTSSQDCIVELI